MNREKIQLEYLLRVHQKRYFGLLQSASGLESWFADEVDIKDKSSF